MRERDDVAADFSEADFSDAGLEAGVVGFGDARDEAADEFVVRALERAQSVARTHGYTRSTLPSWGLDETRPRRSLD